MKIDLGSIKKAGEGFWYNPGTVGGRLERHMKANNIPTIGTFIDNGRLRSMDLTQEDRALRTLFIKGLNMGQIEEMHEWEKKKFWNRFSYLWEAQNFLKIESKEYVIKKQHLPILVEFNKKNRPVMAKFQGFSIPAYFPDDLEFDGMDHHMAWDKCVFFRDLPYLSDKAASTVSGAVFGK